jgi:quercetin dioxygenase-like cupin family protein
VPGGKLIEEHIGRVNSGDETLSIARMVAPPGWEEPAQTPAFTEYTVVLRGTVLVEHAGGTTEVAAGQSLVTEPGEKVRYSTGDEGAEYIAVCLPAFSPDTANRA